MANACEECTLHCRMMHKKKKDPSSLVTTFFKVMMGEDYSKILFLPPKFARGAKKLGDTHLEDFSGVKWKVKLTKIDNSLAFEEGWNAFASAHGLRKGDFLVFHYIRESHYFVVLMYGPSGSPELRHFGASRHQNRETKKNNNKSTVNGQSPSEGLTICNDFSHESSSKSEPLVHGLNGVKTINEKLNEAKMSPNENTTNTQQLVASSSRSLVKETDQRSESLVKNTDKETDQRSESLAKNTTFDDMVSKGPTTVKPLSPVNNDIRHEHDEHSRMSLQPIVVESDDGLKNKVAAFGGGSDETEIRLKYETLMANAAKKRKEGIARQSEAAHSNSMDKRPRPDNVPIGPAKLVEGEPDTSVSRSHNSDYPFTPTGISHKPIVGPAKLVEGEPDTPVSRSPNSGYPVTPIGVSPKPTAEPAKHVKGEPDTLVSRLHNSGYPFTSTRISHKSTVGPAKLVKREPDTSVSRTYNSGYPSTPTGISPKPTAKHTESIKKEPTMNRGSGVITKREPKPEPVDYDEAPLSGSSNTSFSAVMSSYEYLELPDWVEVKSRVILLRNGSDLWAVLFQTKYGLKALIQNWGTFAKEKGFKPGDKCEFVLVSEPSSRSPCNVFDVHVTR